MLFHSPEFLIFMVAVFSIYLMLKHRAQNWFLLAASYGFYGFLNPQFCILIFGSTLVDYACGIKIEAAPEKPQKKRWLWVSLGFNLGILAYFKYRGFFVDSVADAMGLFGMEMNWTVAHLVLPVGISFYTFQTLSYTIDIYRGQLKPIRRFDDFALFVAFFPQLVAGPIERARNLLPQICKPRTPSVDGFTSGIWLIFLGLYKKLFIADQLGPLVAQVFGTPGTAPVEGLSGIDVLIGAALFSFQVYADFSGYSDMARGLARLLGFELMENFRAPYLARNIQDFWTRWHISLSTWIKDYLFYPLALSPTWGKRLGVGGISVVTMLIMGLWHGPNWTFALWGVFHGLVIVLYMKARPMLLKHTRFEGRIAKALWIAASVLFTFTLCSLSEIFFRSQTVGQAGEMFAKLVTDIRISPYSATLVASGFGIYALLMLLDIVEVSSGKHEGILNWKLIPRRILQAAMAASLVHVFLTPGALVQETFYYFQF